MKKTIFSFTVIYILLALSTKAYPQSGVLDQKVTLSFESITLGNLLDHISSVYKIKFSYSVDNIPQDTTVSIKAFNLPLLYFINLLCKEAGLMYLVIDEHIVLRKKPFNERAFPRQPKEVYDIKNKQYDPASEVYYDSYTPTESTPLKSLQPINPFDNRDLKSFSRILNEAATIKYLKQRPIFDDRRRKKVRVAVGLLASYDRFGFNFKERPNRDQKYYSGKNFSTGISTTFWPGEKISASIALLFSTKSYYLDYNYKINNPEDPFPFPKKTTVCLTYTQFPVDVNYQLFKSGKFSLYLSAGFTAEFLIREEENTGFFNAEDKATDYFVEENNKFLWGGTLGLKLWYNLSKSVSVFFKPDYISYFTPLNEVIMDSNPQLLKLKTGISLNIKENK